MTQLSVYCLGPKGTFSDLVTHAALARKSYTLTYLPSFLEIREQLQAHPEAIGVWPVENSITSNVHANIDGIFGENFFILSEAFFRVRLALFALPGVKLEEVRSVYSHPKALEQCHDFLKKQDMTPIPVQSTAHGRELLLDEESSSTGVIGSHSLGSDGKLLNLTDEVSNDPFNITRFLFVSTGPQSSWGIQNKLSAILTLSHRPASLARLLTAVADAGGNLSKIESRPIPGTEWEYRFWIDIEFEPESLLEVKKALRSHVLSEKILGVYCRGEIFE